MRKFVVTLITENEVLLYSEVQGVTVAISREQLPNDVQVGDELYHIEHGYFDLYGSDNVMKKGLIKLMNLRKVEG